MGEFKDMSDGMIRERFKEPGFAERQLEAVDELLVRLVQKDARRDFDVAAARKDRDAEILRLRTTETAAAHALDGLRQFFGLDLVQGEHPSQTRERIEAEMDRQRSCKG